MLYFEYNCIKFTDISNYNVVVNAKIYVVLKTKANYSTYFTVRNFGYKEILLV